MSLLIGLSDIAESLRDSGFMPHGMCYMWNPATLWSNVIGDAVTAIAYFMIPGFLIFFIRKRKQIEFKGIFLAFAAFIISCGAVHALSIVNVWVPLYNLSGVMKLSMAGVSMATVVLMFINMPIALKIPSPSELQVINDQLRKEIEEKTRLQDALEKQTEKLSSTLKLLNSTQEAANIGSWRFRFDNNAVLWSDQTYRIHDMELGEQVIFDTALKFFKSKYHDEIDEVLKNATENGTGWDREWELVNADNEDRWVRSIGYPIYEDGEVVGAEGLLMDVHDQRKASDELKIRSKELEETNKELESFSYSISHDLRAPLRSINGYSEILQEDHADKLDGEGQRILNIVRESALKMGELIDDILSFSRLGRRELEKEEVNMEMVARTVKEQVISFYDTDASVNIAIEQLPNAKGDLALIRQVYQNLIENAIKYSSENEEINVEVGSFSSGEATVYFVKDNGVGFNMKYHDKIFGVFQRLHSEDEIEGTGVGLAIVKRIIQRHHGEIWAESNPGEGSVFYFKLEKN